MTGKSQKTIFMMMLMGSLSLLPLGAFAQVEEARARVDGMV